MAEATQVETLFARYCAEESLVEDATAPHGEAFYAGYHAAINAVIDLSATARPDASLVPALAGLREFRDRLNGVHHQINNYGGSEGDQFRDGFEAMLWLAIDYLLPDFDPEYEVTLRRVDG